MFFVWIAVLDSVSCQWYPFPSTKSNQFQGLSVCWCALRLAAVKLCRIYSQMLPRHANLSFGVGNAEGKVVKLVSTTIDTFVCLNQPLAA